MNKTIQTDPLNWKDGLKIVLAVLTFGVGWFADNQTTMIAYSAMLIVWLLGTLAKSSEKFKWLQGKGPLTVLVFVVSFILAYLFSPFTLSAPPAWTGDAGTYVPLLSAWISAIVSVFGKASFEAMSVYNILLVQVLEKLPHTLSRWLQ